MQLLLLKLDSPEAIPEYASITKKRIAEKLKPGDWNEIRTLAKGHRIVLLLPDNDVVLTSVNIPSKNKKQLIKAVPFALEESLAEDIEELHFAIHKENNSDLAHVAIINRTLLSQYIDKLERERLTVHFALPQLFLLEYHADGWTVVRDGSRVRVRKNSFDGFSCSESMIKLFLAEEIEKAPPQVLYSNMTAEQLGIDLNRIDVRPLADQASFSVDSLQQAFPLNLMQGFVRNKATTAINLKQWKPALAMTALLLVCWTVILLWQNHQLSEQRDQLDNAILRVYKQTFPGSRVVDPTQQMTSKLKELQAGVDKPNTSPLPLIADIGPLLKKSSGMQLNEIRFDNNELQLSVKAGSLAQLETFKTDAAKNAKLQVNIKSSTTTANQVEAILLVKHGNPAGDV